MYDRGDQDRYESHEESEYHFSDDDVNYETEVVSKSSRLDSLKTGFLARFKKSRRLYIGVAVFIILVYVSYQMLFPSNPQPVTEFTTPAPGMSTAATTPAAKPMPSQPPSQPLSTRAQEATTPQEKPMVNIAGSPVIPVGQEMTITVPQAPPPAAPAIAPQAPQVAQPTPASAAPTVPIASPPVQAVSGQPQAVVSAPVAAQAVPLTAQSPIAPTGMPPAQQSAPAVPSAAVQPTAAVPQMVTAAPAQPLAQMVNPVQAEYVQKLNDFEAQYKATQDQLSVLTAKVGAMEEQINQLVATLNKSVDAAPAPAPAEHPVESPRPPVTGEPRASYTVQAIIPGRAWLKADNGETVTVAEGDVLRGYGRVTKIDPYNGVVEIDTGTKTMSLSYGNGG